MVNEVEKSGLWIRGSGALLALALAAGAAAWYNGWRTGHQDTIRTKIVRNTVSREVNAFTDPVMKTLTPQDYENLFTAYCARKKTARTAAEKQDLANSFYKMGESAHARSGASSEFALKAYQEALSLFQEANDRTGETSALAVMADSHALLGQGEKAEQCLRRAIRLHEAGAGTLAQRADRVYGLGCLLAGGRRRKRYGEGKRLLDKSLSLYQKAGSEPGQADCLHALGRIALEEKSPALAHQLLTESAQIFSRLGKTESRAAVLGSLGDVALAEGNLPAAQLYYDEGLSVWEKIHQPYWTGRFKMRLARLAHRRGEEKKAETLASEARLQFARSNSPAEQTMPLLFLADLQKSQGRLPAAQRNLTDALNIFQAAGDTEGVTRSRSLLKNAGGAIPVR